MARIAFKLWRTVRNCILAFLVITTVSVVPTGAWFYAQGWPSSWNSADWSSAGVAPEPASVEEAIIQVYAARAGRWKSVFAVHTWIALKDRGANRFTRYEVVGWGQPVRRDAYPVDGRWYSNVPDVIFEVRGADADALIPQIEAAVARYPHSRRGSYTVWPGPNSNTFIAWLGRAIPELGLELPPTAIGKDYLGDGVVMAQTPSGTGWQVSWSGLLGMAIGRREGLEFQFLGTTIGIDPQSLALKLPAVGMLGLTDITAAFAQVMGAFRD
jgi:hypothetical protein